MDTQILHDPRTKKQIKDNIFEYIYSPILKQFNFRLVEIINKNCVLFGIGDQVFSYKGETYSINLVELPRKLPRLSKQLIPVMDEYLRDLRQLNNYEIPYVVGFINQVLNSSNYIQDYLKVFPDAIHSPVEKMVASCPCRATRLAPESVLELQDANQISIGLIKHRLVSNLLI